MCTAGGKKRGRTEIQFGKASVGHLNIRNVPVKRGGTPLMVPTAPNACGLTCVEGDHVRHQFVEGEVPVELASCRAAAALGV